MKHIIGTSVLTLALIASPCMAHAQARVNACTLLPREEVRKHLPWKPMLDQIKSEEEAIGSSGSSCNHPSATIQVMTFTQATIDAARKRGALETLSGVGDEAYFYNNPKGYAEVYVRVGKRLGTVQANVDKDMATVRPGAIALAKELATRMH